MADYDSYNNFSSPVPVIGLYIAGASVACMLMMLWDIGAGVVAKKRWLPCKVFKLDSVTLTLLGVVAKIPVDLTSSMPSRYDQLSKLTGTVMICICMGILMPSLGASNESECFTNMVALSIFVITVTVNICIQLRTGVIVFFFKEHVIILCLMLLLLLLLWESSMNSRGYKTRQAATYKDLVKTGNSSLFGRLKLCYLYSYSSDPYFFMCRNTIYASVTIVCTICSVILAVATFRSVILKKLDSGSGGHSDYNWSMKFIVVIQNLTVIVGTLAILFRWLALFRSMKVENLYASLWNRDDATGQKNQILGMRHTWKTSIGTLYKKSISAAQLLIMSPFFLVRKCFSLYKHDRSFFFGKLPHECLLVASEYIAAKSVDEIIKFREVCCRVSLENLLQLLPRTSAPQSYPRVNGYQAYLQKSFSSNRPDAKVEQKVRSLSVVLLMKIAQICIQDHLPSFLLCAYMEAKEIIHFIDKTLQTRDLTDTSKLSYAMWAQGDFSCLIPANILRMQSGLRRAEVIMDKLKENFEYDKIYGEIEYIVNFIKVQNYSSIEELSNFIKEMLVYMLRLLISQLPVAIHKSLSECPREEFEGGVKFALSFLFKMESLGAKENDIGWLFPPESGISSFIVDKTLAPDSTGPLRRLGEIFPHSS